MKKTLTGRLLTVAVALAVLMTCVLVMPVSASTEYVNSFSGEYSEYLASGSGQFKFTPSGSPGLWDRIAITISDAGEVTAGVLLIYAPNGKCLNCDNPFMFGATTGTKELTFWGLSKGEYTFDVAANAPCRVTIEFNT